MVTLREYRPEDAESVNTVALAAFEQFSGQYEDWPGFARLIAGMSNLAATADIIVAIVADKVVGAVAYVGPGAPKAAFFDPDWAIMRMLVVSPEVRGQGIGRALALACIERAREGGAGTMALHTSPIMEVALPMYLRMGFGLHGHVAPIHGVAYSVYTRELT